MKVSWTNKALSDLARLYEFLAAVNKPAAARIVCSLTSPPNLVLRNPHIGERLKKFDPREVRKILIQHDEVRYEIQEFNIYILRLWHTRKNR